jgi:hypothetical protein
MKIILTAVALLAATPALAGEGAAPGATVVQLVAGERLDICAAGLVASCPVSRFICDDPRVATVELAAAGKPAALVGVGVGRTTCAIYGFEGAARRVLEVVVSGAPAK